MITIPKRNDKVIELTGVVKPYPDFDTISFGNMDGSPFIFFDAGLYTLNVGWDSGNNTLYFSRFNAGVNGYVIESSITMPGDNIVGSDVFCRLYSPANETFVYLAPISFNTFSASVDFVFAPISNCPLDGGILTETGTVTKISPVPGVPTIAISPIAIPSAQQSDGFSYYTATANTGVFDGLRIFGVATDGITFSVFNIAAFDVSFNNSIIVLSARDNGSSKRLFCSFVKTGSTGFLKVDAVIHAFDNGIGTYEATSEEYELDDATLNSLFAAGNNPAIVTNNSDDNYVLFAYPDGVSDMFAIEISKDFDWWDMVTFTAADIDAQSILDNYAAWTAEFAYGYQDGYLVLSCGPFLPFTITTAPWWATNTPVPIPYGGGAATNPLRLSEIIKMPCFHPCVPHAKKGLKINV